MKTNQIRSFIKVVKKSKIIFIISFFYMVHVIGQAPNKMSYQSVIRNNSNELLVSSNIGARISIIKDTPSGETIYSETHQTTTNSNGLMTLIIGSGEILLGNLSEINWSSGTFFIKTEIDINGGNNFTLSGTTQLLSVPFALYAQNAGNVTGSSEGGKTYLILSGDITDEQAIERINHDVGPNTQFIYIKNTTQLTHVDISNLDFLIEIVIENNQALNSIIISDVNSIYSKFEIRDNNVLNSIIVNDINSLNGITTTITNCPQLDLISFPNLTNCLSGTLYISDCSVNTLSLPNLTNCLSGTLHIYESSVNTLSLPNLNSIDHLKITRSNIVNIDISSLLHPNNITLYHNGSLPQNFLQNIQSIGNFTYSAGSYWGEGYSTLNFENLQSINGIFITSSNFLESINLESLNTITPSGSIVIDGHSLLNNINIPNLTTFDGIFTFTNNHNINSLNLPVITISASSTIDITNNSLLSSISFPNLENNLGVLKVKNNINLTSLNISNLNSSTGEFYLMLNTMLTSVDFNNLETISGNFYLPQNNISEISFPNLSNYSNYPFTFRIDENNLSSEDVNYLLGIFVNMQGSGIGTFRLQNQYVDAPPTGSGITNKQTLIDQGHTVTTD